MPDESGHHQEEELSWDKFVAGFDEVIPGTAAKIKPELEIEEVAGRDRIVRGLLVAVLRRRLADAPADLLASVRTFGEAFEWCKASAATEVVPKDAKAQQALKEMRTATARLRPIRTDDLPELYASALDPRWSFRWRFRGATPSFQDFSSALWAGTLSQFIVERRLDDRAVGVVSCYNARPDAGVAYVGFTRIVPSSSSPSSEMLEGGYLFLSFLFRNWSFRKLYAEVPGFTWDQFAAGQNSFFHVEGTLLNHDYFDGRFWDHRIVAIYREEWESLAVPQLAEFYSDR